MTDDKYDPGHPTASEELSEILRKSVERILAEPVPDDAVRRAVERYLAIDSLPAQKRPQRKWLALAVGLAGAAGLLALFWPGSGDDRRPNESHEEAVSAPQANDVSPDQLPSLQACRLALRESPEAMLALLDRGAGQPLMAASRWLGSGPPERSNGPDR